MKEQTSTFFRQIGRAFACGVPLLKSLETIYLESEDKKFKELVLDVLECMQVEPSFYLSLKNSSANFSPSLLGMVQACEDNARLDSGLEDIAKAIEENIVPAFFNMKDGKPLDNETVTFENILLMAVEKNASDIHILPQNKNYQIKFRISDRLDNFYSISKDEGLFLTNKIKEISCLRLDINNLPQDGRIRLKVKDKSLDLRLAVLPTVLGEKLTLRVLSGRHIVLNPEQIFTSKKDLQKFQELISTPFGMVLFCGPTGSGKTTTAYTALHSLINKGGLSIASIEDPVEYVIEGVSHTQVRSNIGLTYSAGLRSILRSDPDVVYVGEVCDEDTFLMMNKTALTGHLVLSTMHTTDCLSTIEKLMELGVEPFNIATALSTLVSQRLVRKLCFECKEEEQLAKSIAEKLNFSGDIKTYRAKGCDECNHTGYKGRVAVYEFLKITKELKDLIREKNLSKIEEYINGPDHETMLNQTLNLVREEITSVEETMRIFS
ncbi:MAG: type II secretion system protein GspE [Candidatus Cloacimonadota bacterium]|nr:MAG: type II secretion system protein GspE [Candidatus Cloacimonadota bacterium]